MSQFGGAFFARSTRRRLLSDTVAIFNAETGDISPWCDHTFSANPDSLYIEEMPAGGFYELFDEDKKGVRYAVVTTVHLRKLLRLEGLPWLATQIVGTYKLTVKNDATL